MQSKDIQAFNVARSMEENTVDCKDARPAGTPSSYMEPNIRRMRAYLAVYDCGGVQRAAEKLHLTQSALTRAIQELERQLKLTLFERTRRGMIATEFGHIVAERVRRALGNLNTCERELLASYKESGTIEPFRGFSSKVTYRELSALIAIADHQTETTAAKHLALSQPAVTQALRDLEHLVGEPLFVRTSRGMAATMLGEIVLRRAKLAFSEIAAAGSDIAAHVGSITGRILVGTLPLAGTLVTPRAINRLLLEHPNLKVVVIDGTYQSLIQRLLCGDLDMIIGGLNHPKHSEIVQHHLFQDFLSVVVRKNHPLAGKKALSSSDLAGVNWVVPRSGTPARNHFDQVIAAAGLDLGDNPIESEALLTVRALLMESDRFALISRHQIHFEVSAGLLTVLPFKIPNTALPVGVHMRAEALPSAGVQAMVRHLHGVSTEMSDPES